MLLELNPTIAPIATPIAEALVLPFTYPIINIIVIDIKFIKFIPAILAPQVPETTRDNVIAILTISSLEYKWLVFIFLKHKIE